MAPQPTDQTHLKQYFQHLAGNSTVMHALQIGADIEKDLLAFGDKPGLANSMSMSLMHHLKSLTTKNAGLVPGSLHQALEVYFLQCCRRKNAAFSEKRIIARVLGLHATPLPAKSLADTGTVRMVTHNRSAKTSYKRGTLLVDHGNEDLVGSGDTTLSVPVDDSWYVIEPDESIIFVNSKGSVTLAVLHSKCGQCPDLLTYVNSIINEAVNDRKGVRPTHGGELVLFGWNAGPHHAHVFGLVNNLTNKKKLSMTTRQQKDSHALGILALSWNLLIASLPAEVSASCIEAIDEAGLPAMTVKGNDLDFGYTLDLPGGPLCFSTAEQAPSEAYIPIHIDQLYAPYVMNWVTLHAIMDPEQCQLHGGHSSGGNYVDVSFKVVVKCATDTVMSMQPCFQHGMTLARDGVCRQGTAINFLRHIKQAFDEAIAIEGDVKAMVT
ncbi:uncharacterized protein F5891DRAFT_1187037 [Suillus fuscotomentosus]|uniref:Uncharacterized protein n=1 Tax=Suillus fuscotomentosus TaxID=1912939 RepID=A0AAD4HMF9_9AGAM|nr:uncharacterized protein F5891DRAFT_1187037 [Suillus fuscotomentosus]KAG1902008.1 hypothetical protein F5891DRAFT_1187037 [Suillus fuscotomentosus]